MEVDAPGVFGDWEGRLSGRGVPPFCVGLRRAQPWVVAPAGYYGAARLWRLESHHLSNPRSGCAMCAAASVAELAEKGHYGVDS